MRESTPAPSMGGPPDEEAPPASTRAPIAPGDERRLNLDRYVHVRLLGRGSMGAVHLVRDRETGEHLALKKLFRMDARAILRLKREFRSLADKSHPNLVKVYELGRAEDAWFIVMEYVEGEELWSYVGIDTDSTLNSGVRANDGLTSHEDRLTTRVLPAFGQLATAVQALHQARMLHRDLKPSNVLVTNHRVVVLDFGLVRELDASAASLTEEGVISGTPAYMSPEQAVGKPLTEASDWYAYGAMLYEALTGELPFDGPIYEILHAKLDRDPPTPLEREPMTPPHLSELCMALLAREPAARLDGAQVLARLRVPIGTPSPTASLFPHAVTESEAEASPTTPLFGRDRELSALRDAIRLVESGSSVVVHLSGPSGSGKTALAESFLDGLQYDLGPKHGEQPLVLRSRCYEREAMPFKALDGVIDALVRDLSHMDEFEVSHLLPTDVELLARVFPALERLRAVQHLIARHRADRDEVRNRQRAEAALRELFRRTAARRPVIVWIDDLQWGDLDSAGILRGWLADATRFPLLLLLSYRSDETETSECLRMLLTENANDVRTLELAPLPSADLRAMFAEKLAPHGMASEELIERLVHEAQGSPFLAAQLATLAEEKHHRGDQDVVALSIRDLVSQANTMLPKSARRLLSLLSIAGRPISAGLALQAAGIERGGRDALHALGRLQLVRTRNVRDQRLLEVYHDRVRQAVQQALRPEQHEQLNKQLLLALELSDQADAEWLHTVAMAAHKRDAAYHHGRIAAQQAATALAFERAVELYQRCLQLSDRDSPDRGDLYFKLGATLSWCGRGARAADAYLQASRLAEGERAERLRQLACSHLMRSGRFEEGEALLHEVVEALGVTMPASNRALLLRTGWERMRLKWRGASYTPRASDQLDKRVLAKLDGLNALRGEMGSVDPLRSGLLLAQQLRLALDTGEPMRVLQALFGASYVEATVGTPDSERRTEALLQRIAKLAEELDTPAARMHLHAARALSSWAVGRSEQVLEPADEVHRLYAHTEGVRLEGYYFLRQSVSAARIGALLELSDFPTVMHDLEAEVQLAERTDNRAALLSLALSRTYLDELMDRPQDAIKRLKAERAQLPPLRYSLYHALHDISVGVAACAAGEYHWGMQIVEQDWQAYAMSPLPRVSMLGFLMQLGRVQLLLNQHLTARRAGAPLPDQLDQEVKRLAGSRLARRAEPAALTQRARLAHARGDTPKALRLLEEAHGTCICPAETERIDYAAGLLLGGEHGRERVARAATALRGRSVVNPERFVGACFPELLRPGS